MTGSDVVFHVAGWYKIGSPDWMAAESINVGGTRKVLRLAHELGVPRIVYVSTVAVFGDTHGRLVDEEYYDPGPFLTEYDRTKWLAHYKVALPMISKGAPIIIVQPGVIYGPGDTSTAGQLMSLYYNGQMPVVPGSESTWTYAHVEDIAEGIVLAAEKGRIGESYILAGPAVPLAEMFDYWAHLLGRRPPLLRVPARLIRPLAPLAAALSAFVPLPSLFSEEAVRTVGATYAARADKARAELGWHTRPLQEGMAETFAWIAGRARAEPAAAERRRQLAGLAGVAAALLLLFWLVGRRRR
jgi:nucleoside-diphosphate-sugar epimerase